MAAFFPHVIRLQIEGRLAMSFELHSLHSLFHSAPLSLIQFDVTNAHADNYNAVRFFLCQSELFKALGRETNK